MCIYIGSEPVIAYKNNIQSLGHKRVQLDDLGKYLQNKMNLPISK